MLSNVEEAASTVLDDISTDSSTSTSLIFSLDTFTAKFSDIIPDVGRLSSIDIAVLLVYLCRDKAAITLSRSPTSTSDTSEPLVIKFESASRPKSRNLSQQDFAVAKLKTLEQSLCLQISAIESRISDCSQRFQPLLAQSGTVPSIKAQALDLLRQRKMLEATLQQRLNSRIKVEQTLVAIDDAVTNVELANVMEVSTSVLRDLNEQVGGAEGAARVMDKLAESQMDTDDISRVLQQDSADVVDEDKLENDLDALLKEETAREHADSEKRTRSHNVEIEEQELPSVPPNAPQVELRPRSSQSAHEPAEEVGKQLSEMDLDEGSLTTVSQVQSA